MTRRICLFGNSHIAALKEAHRAGPDRWPGLEMQFVGLHGELLMQTVIRDGRLAPQSDAAAEALQAISGLSEVDLRSFDAFVVTGCNIATFSAVTVYGGLRWPDLPSLDRQADLAAMRPILVSEGVARATLVAMLAERLGLRFIRHLRAGTDRPIWLTQQPNVSASVLEGETPAKLRTHLRAMARGDAAHIARLFAEVAPLATCEAGAGFLPQPAATVVEDILTDTAYCEGATRLAARPGIPQPARDFLHANAAYGALVLDQISGALAR